MRLNPRFVLLCTLWFLTPTKLVYAQVSDVPQPGKKALDSLLSETTKAYKIPGCQVVLFSKEKIIFSRSMGVANINESKRIDNQTVFEVASLSKPVFHYLLILMVINGELPKTFFSDSIKQYIDTKKPIHTSLIPQVRGLSDFLIFSDPYPESWFRSLTVKQLLTHTAGLGNWMDPNPAFILLPGKQFIYSDEGYILLQRVVENYTQKSLQQLIKEHFTGPLKGVNRFVWDSSTTNYAYGHNVKMELSRDLWKTKEGCVHGSLSSSAQSYAKFMQCLARTTIWQSSDTVKVINNLYWQPGWGLEKTIQGNMFWHWGNDICYQHFACYFPVKDIGLIVLTNSENGLHFCQSLAERIFQLKLKSLRWVLGN